MNGLNPRILCTLSVLFLSLASTTFSMALAQEASESKADAAAADDASDDSNTTAAEVALDIKKTETTVGIANRLEQVVLPGPELEAKPVTSNSPVVLRIDNVYPHGSDFRYDFEFYVLDPGDYNLLDFLKRVDGQPLEFSSSIPVSVARVLPPGQVEPNVLKPNVVRGLGGYSQTVIVGGIIWFLVLLLLIFARRGSEETTHEKIEKKQTLAERLRPMVEKAVQGKLDREQCADLEMALVAYWRRRLKLNDKSADEVISTLKSHDEAGPLLNQLERWLHKPGQSQDVDVAALLKPYRSISAAKLTTTRAGVST